MKEVTLFYLEHCPHCRQATRYWNELVTQNPAWRQIPLTTVEESQQPETAQCYDYYYVPTYYVGNQKVHEGHAEMSDVERVLRLAEQG